MKKIFLIVAIMLTTNCLTVDGGGKPGDLCSPVNIDCDCFNCTCEGSYLAIGKYCSNSFCADGEVTCTQTCKMVFNSKMINYSPTNATCEID